VAEVIERASGVEGASDIEEANRCGVEGLVAVFDQPSLVVHTDSGCTQRFVWAVRARSIGFFVVARSNAQVHGAISDTVGVEEIWKQARHQRREPASGSSILAPSTACSPLSSTATGVTTATKDGDPVELDQTTPAHAHVELHLQRLKDSGLLAFPSHNVEALGRAGVAPFSSAGSSIPTHSGRAPQLAH
jgi:hypothetical protein